MARSGLPRNDTAEKTSKAPTGEQPMAEGPAERSLRVGRFIFTEWTNNINKDPAKVYKNNNKADLYSSLLYCVTCACMERLNGLKRIDLGCVTRYYSPNTLPTKNGGVQYTI